MCLWSFCLHVCARDVCVKVLDLLGQISQLGRPVEPVDDAAASSSS